MKPWRRALLIFESFLFALILVLPQVDIPDFAFHRGSAPIVAKPKLSGPPVLAIVTTSAQSRLPRQPGEVQNEHIKPVAHSTSHSLLSLLCTLLC